MLRTSRRYALLAALGLSACSGDLFSGGQQAQAEFFFERDATGRTEFRLEGINGNIDVIAESGTEELTVGGFRRVRSSSLADAQEQLERLQVVVSIEGDAIVIRTEQPSDTQGRTFEVEYNLIVPDRLEGIIRNVNGNVLIDAMDDDVEVITTNGNITLQDHFGSADVTSTNGNLDATVTISPGGVIASTWISPRAPRPRSRPDWPTGTSRPRTSHSPTLRALLCRLPASWAMGMARSTSKR